jgi:hypothetical protein
MDAEVCVYSGNALDWDCLDYLSIEDGFVAALKDSDSDDHDAECEWHDDPKSCSCGWGDYWEPSMVWYANGDWFTTDKGERDTKGTVVFAHNCGHNTIQVCRSPLTWERFRCSLCYPGQADANTPGDIRCYRLPNWMVADKDLWVGDDPEDNV